MNIDKIYHIKNFDLFKNIYTIYKKHIVTHKRVVDDNGNITSEVLSDFYKYIPVYGHYYNNENNFICKKIMFHRVLEEVKPHNFLILNNEELARPYKGGIYVAKDIDELYNIIDKLKKYQKQNEES